MSFISISSHRKFRMLVIVRMVIDGSNLASVEATMFPKSVNSLVGLALLVTRLVTA